MDKGRRHFLTASVLVPWMFASACSNQPPITRVGGSLRIGSEPLFLARELGLYGDNILRLVEMPSNSANLMALVTGDIEAATLTLDECLYAREGGVDVRVILVFDYSVGRTVIMCRPEISKLLDLKGRRIGVEENAASALMLARVLETAGLAPHEVVKVRVTGDQQLRAYQAGEVDAVVSWEPISTQLEAAGAHRLFDSMAFPGLIVDVLAARADALERSPESFRTLLAGYFQALDYLRSSPQDATRRMAPRMGLRPDQVRSARGGIQVIELAANRDWLDGARPGLIAAADKVARSRIAAGLLKQMPMLGGLADPRFLPGPTR
ncbi:MAG: ABC transporter substrate-binding protein [Thiobacillus sp.]|uniref:ABC transporter substrate-binding protein n=1 Tax=Thiobacillus sp. TaxID=924 RepID=UPI002895658B|nr:ABC transporter substrate-binding protein [Thiobacillus sp.]MDT3707547.1 ABC transporter substrate-binding protein [Thiobacillus sp.]